VVVLFGIFTDKSGRKKCFSKIRSEELTYVYLHQYLALTVVDESVTIGHPSEFFRELKKIFASVDDDLRMITADKKLELTKTPIDGVAKFEEGLRGRCFHEVVRTGYQVGGVVAVCVAIVGIVVELLFFNIEALLYLFILGGLFALFIAGGVALAVSKKQFFADLWLTFEGESYQAKTVGPQGERVSVFTRALLKTDWQPMEKTSKIPSEFTKRMEENKLKLDLQIAVILPSFELEAPRIPVTKEYGGSLNDSPLGDSVSPERGDDSL